MLIDVWGVVFELENVSDDLVAALHDEFSGAVAILASGQHCHKIIFEDSLANIFKREFVRHKSGSSGNKYFTNGEVFESKIQNRFVQFPLTLEMGSLFSSDQVVCYSTASCTFVFSSSPSCYFLNDIVENVLLNNARGQDWVQVHASAWVSDGAARVAIGSSGAGKTTRALRHVMDGATLLGNDRIFFRVNNNRIQARGFPLPINIGCGTIRSLGLPINHFDKKDEEKIRLTPKEVCDLFKPDYINWFDVEQIFCPNSSALDENIYWMEDDCHPSWNPATHQCMSQSNKDRVLALLDDVITCSALF